MIRNFIQWINSKSDIKKLAQIKLKSVCVNSFIGSQDIKIQYCDSIKWIIIKNKKN
jgi:hypothetical protein